MTKSPYGGAWSGRINAPDGEIEIGLSENGKLEAFLYADPDTLRHGIWSFGAYLSTEPIRLSAFSSVWKAGR